MINPTHQDISIKPSIDVLKKIADTLEVSIDLLVSDTDDPINELQIKNGNIAERMRMIELDDDDRDALIRVIDLVLTRKKVLDLLSVRSAI